MVPLDVGGIDAAYYVGNCHKWLCAPKGAGFLVARKDKQDGLVPTVISHGWNAERARSRYRVLFDWLGTDDPSPMLCVTDALALMGSLLHGGWPEFMARNRALAAEMRRHVLERLALPAPCPEHLLGAMAAFPLGPGDAEALHQRLLHRHGIEVPVFPWGGGRMLRLSAQVYNELSDSQRLAQALQASQALESSLPPTSG